MDFGQDYIDNVANKYGIPTNIYRGLIATESGYNPLADNPRSSAYGYTQLLAGTAAQLGVNRYDPAQNLDGGARYLAQQYQTFGDWRTALAAYYQGPGSVQKQGITSAGANYANKVFSNAGKTIGDFAKGIKDTFTTKAARAGIAVATGGASEAVLGVTDAIGITGDCNVICQLKKWLSEGRFYVRFPLVIVGVVLIAGGLYLIGTGQVQKLISNAKG